MGQRLLGGGAQRLAVPVQLVLHLADEVFALERLADEGGGLAGGGRRLVERLSTGRAGGGLSVLVVPVTGRNPEGNGAMSIIQSISHRLVRSVTYET